MPRMPNVCGPILVVLIAVLVAGMLYENTNNSTVSWTEPRQDSMRNKHDSQQPLPPPQCSNPSGLIGDSSCCDYETVGKLNVDFSTKLHEIVNMPFFRYFKVNLYKECPFWNNAGLCMNEDCSVETIDQSRVPEQWKAANLAKVSMSSNPLFGALPTRPLMKEQDFCVPETGAGEVYVDLRDNPERFTGYSGPSAAMVWKAIYEENCFDVSKEMTAGCQYCESERAKLKDQSKHADDHDHGKENILVPPEPAPMKSIKPSREEMNEIFSRVPKDKNELQQLMQGIAKDGGDEESCLEKRVYYRLISGLHASISIHICDEWFNQTTGEWGPNLDCFISRVGMHPERLENIYFDYVVMLRAVSKISDFLAGYEYLTGDESVDRDIMTSVRELVSLVKNCPPTFNEKLLFLENQGQGKQLKSQFRDHFRNVTRVMDCVGCEKCRLWGKVQTQGLGTALKILFSYDDAALQGHKANSILTRSEIVTLINTFNRLSESISAIERFQVMYKERLEREQAQISSSFSTKSFIKAPSKEEDDRDAIVYKVRHSCGH
ncbi:endoplasmic reticulum Oxidoreductin 1-domain-containing protein [Gamsiella multidivaricata]|uniref:endoplasmic reticulum Oxidoreductin 1-domain-containing protein n=1 Tax=Gamsiella multidivaricata TaxID=101098 RepID=UPI002220FA47|nr:endoplasmic reticulum Oxidoreductin 1-domain-containing protein [Gamsiella multidivaricata]KAI7819807.1 endoplasmic reticulum Oxidoreductin 1-domain-containing protein [Gamsiella multidivaricata]